MPYAIFLDTHGHPWTSMDISRILSKEVHGCAQINLLTY